MCWQPTHTSSHTNLPRRCIIPYMPHRYASLAIQSAATRCRDGCLCIMYLCSREWEPRIHHSFRVSRSRTAPNANRERQPMISPRRVQHAERPLLFHIPSRRAVFVDRSCVGIRSIATIYKSVCVCVLDFTIYYSLIKCPLSVFAYIYSW